MDRNQKTYKITIIMDPKIFLANNLEAFGPSAALPFVFWYSDTPAGSTERIHFYRTVCAILILSPLSYPLFLLLTLAANDIPFGQVLFLPLSYLFQWCYLPFFYGAGSFGDCLQQWFDADWMICTIISMVLYAVFIAAGCLGGYGLYRRTKKQTLEKNCEA